MEQVDPSHGLTKASIRQRIWNYIEKHNLANFPRPVHHRIPNFKGANAAAEKLKELDVFRKARTIKVNPDKPQEHARFLILEARKTLLVPTPRLRTGLFNRIVPPTNATKEQLRICSQSQGVKKFSVPVGLDDPVTVDLVIIGSVAVSPEGYRIGKGEGFADMEYAMMVTMGAVTKDTIVITTVHDCQVLDDIPEDLMCPHDLMVDYILTTTRIIQCGGDRDQTHITKPSGILWQSLSREKFNQIPILKTLRYREQKAGKDVRLKDETEIPHCQEIKSQGNREPKSTTKHIQSENRGKSGFNDKAKSRGAYSQQNQNLKHPNSSASKQPISKPANDSSSSKPQEPAATSSKKLFVGGIPRGLRVKDFKQEIREKDVNPKNINWVGGKRFAFLQFVTDDEVVDALEKLNGITFLDKPVRVELCRDEPRDLKSNGES